MKQVKKNEDKLVRVHFLVPESMKTYFRELAAEEGLEFSSLLRNILTRVMRERKKA